MRLTNIEKDVASMKTDVAAMREIIETWNNGKGFVTTMRVLSKIGVWMAATLGALAVIYQAIKHFGQS